MSSADPKATIGELLSWAKQQLSDSESPLVDARVMLANVLDKSPSYLHTWPDKKLDTQEINAFARLVEQRQQGQPVAYLLGYRDFWSLRLKVSQDTLIPRADTETLVEAALSISLPKEAKVVDLGTGTGAIALALASEKPDWHISGIDKVAAAVQLAKQNASENGLAKVTFLQSHWFDALPGQCFDLIVSNPPYVESSSPYLQQGDVRFEPASALTSGPQGLDDIAIIIEKAGDHLYAGGVLMLEHGYQQGEAIRQMLAANDFQEIKTIQDLNRLDRVTMGRRKH